MMSSAIHMLHALGDWIQGVTAIKILTHTHSTARSSDFDVYLRA